MAGSGDSGPQTLAASASLGSSCKQKLLASSPQSHNQQVWGGGQESAFLTSSQITWMLLVGERHSETHCLRH